jgi:hypothetical protein
MAALSAYGMIMPVTITPGRYGGTYSGGAWLAFPLRPSAVPYGSFAGDVFANGWWAEVDDAPVGRARFPFRVHGYARSPTGPEHLPMPSGGNFGSERSILAGSVCV